MGGGQHTHIILSAPEALVPSANREGIVGKVLRLTLCPVAFASGHILITRHEQIAHSTLYGGHQRKHLVLSVAHSKLLILSHSLLSNPLFTKVYSVYWCPQCTPVAVSHC